MSDMIVHLVPLMLGVILSPLAIMALVAELLSRRRRVNGIAFAIGWILAIIVPNPVDASCAILAALAIVGAGLGMPVSLTVTGIFTFVGMLPILIPVIVVLARGENADPFLGKVRVWIAGHTSIMNAALSSCHRRAAAPEGMEEHLEAVPAAPGQRQGTKDSSRAIRVLVGIAAATIAGFGMHAFFSILGPSRLALVIVICVSPVLSWLERRGTPRGLATLAGDFTASRPEQHAAGRGQARRGRAPRINNASWAWRLQQAVALRREHC